MNNALPRYTEWCALRKNGKWTDGIPDWARNHMGQMDDVVAMRSVIEELADFRRLPAVETCAFCSEGKARLLVIRHCSSCDADYSGSPEGRMQARISCNAQECERCSGSGEDPEGFYDQSKGDAGCTYDGPCRNCSGSGEIKPT